MKRSVILAVDVIILLSIISCVSSEENVTLPPAITEQSNETTWICDNTQCDTVCTVCSDNRCHEPSFVCNEQLVLDKLIPESVDKGVSQLNILLRNTGNVNLKDISVAVTGDGISTSDKIPIAQLAAGDKDYAFVKITAEKAGTIDIILKLYLGSTLKETIVRQLTVLEEPKLNITDEVNATAIVNNLEQSKERYLQLEKEFYSKKSEGYNVEWIYNTLQETNTYIKDAQFYLKEENYKNTEVDLNIVDSNLQNIEKGLSEAQKQQQSLKDKVKENLLYIGSLAAALVSIFTANNLIKNSVNTQKLAELQNKLKVATASQSASQQPMPAPLPAEHRPEHHPEQKTENDEQKQV
jgi:hypothetical protein